ncbi:MAG: MFS transporter [Deltaproteobacteria bacterium]|nr:MFS transporter [Deltaproteobacteria bacterium]
MLVHLAFGMCTSIFLILPKHFTTTLHAGPRQIGAVMTMHGVANILLMRPLRHLLSRWSHRRVLALGTLVMAFGGSLFIWVDEVGILAGAGRFFQGAGWACVFTAGSAMAANLAPPGRLAQAIGFFAAALLSTNAIGPAFSEFMLPIIGPTWVWMIGATFGVVAFAIAVRLPTDGDTNSAPSATDKPLPPLGTLIAPHYFVLWFVMGLISVTLFTFHQPFALQRGFQRVSGLLVGFTVTALVVRILSGRLLDRLGHRKVALVTLAGYGLVLIALNALGSIGLEPLGLAFGLTHGAFYPAMMAMCMSTVQPSNRALAISRINTANHLGAICVFGLGYVAETGGYPMVFTGVGCLTVLASLLLVVRRHPAGVTQAA